MAAPDSGLGPSGRGWGGSRDRHRHRDHSKGPNSGYSTRAALGPGVPGTGTASAPHDVPQPFRLPSAQHPRPGPTHQPPAPAVRAAESGPHHAPPSPAPHLGAASPPPALLVPAPSGQHPLVRAAPTGTPPLLTLRPRPFRCAARKNAPNPRLSFFGLFFVSGSFRPGAFSEGILRQHVSA